MSQLRNSDTRSRFVLRPRGVLLIEDDRHLLEMFREALRLDGFKVRTATDGLSALFRIEQELPDVVVLDLHLPDVSGVDIVHDLVARENLAAVPVIVVTGTEHGDGLPVFEVLRKPITADQLVAVVRRAASHRSSHDQSR